VFDDVVHELVARELAPDSISLSLYSHSPVSSGERISSTCKCVSANSSEKALAVGCSSRPLRCRYSSASSPSMVAARVAGVPRPRSGHGFAQFVVVDQLAGAFHRGQQRGFREARRRLGLPCP
jgi:hypothetical protein